MKTHLFKSEYLIGPRLFYMCFQSIIFFILHRAAGHNGSHLPSQDGATKTGEMEKVLAKCFQETFII